jgi:hypothetical protein
VPVKVIRFGVAGGDNALIKGCTFIGTVDGADYAIDFASSSGDYWTVENCRFNYQAFGMDNAMIAARKRAPMGYVIKDCLFLGVGTYLVDFASSTAGGPNGFLTDCRATCTAVQTSVEDVMDAAHKKGLACANLLVTDDLSKVAGKVPIVTAS